jgi:hypothetical protein
MFDNNPLNALLLFRALTMSEAHTETRRAKPVQPSLWKLLRARLARPSTKPVRRQERYAPSIRMRPVHGEPC